MSVLLSPPRSREPQFDDAESASVVIGLVNNMADGALRSTERQFCELLAAASRGFTVLLRLFSLPELARGATGRSHIKQSYVDISELWTSRIDGLIVTGSEPRAPALVDEPYWQTLTKLVDWAEDHTFSTIWSCLAAHAAVLHLDGIPRRPLGEKLSGIFDCNKSEDHPIMFRVPCCWRVPHSRFNGLLEDALVSKSYSILSSSPQAGADIFLKQRKSLFLFFQGHPEYDPGALLREYRRDCERFVAGKRRGYPEVPRNYLDDETKAVLVAYRKRALSNPGPDLVSCFPPVAEEELPYGWRGLAIRLYTNWLSYILDKKAKRLFPTPLPAVEETVGE